jgi:hypothetical protein
MPDPTGIPALDAFLVWATVATVVISLATGLWRFVRAAIRIGRRVNVFFDDWYGQEGRPGVPARPGVLERVKHIEDRMQGVHHELQPNSGASLRDAVDLVNCRLERMLTGDDDECRRRADEPPHPPPSADEEPPRTGGA